MLRTRENATRQLQYLRVAVTNSDDEPPDTMSVVESCCALFGLLVLLPLQTVLFVEGVATKFSVVTETGQKRLPISFGRIDSRESVKGAVGR